MSDSTAVPEPEPRPGPRWPNTYPGALSAVGALLSLPDTAPAAVSVSSSFNDPRVDEPVAQLLLFKDTDSLQRVVGWARTMDEVRSVVLVPYEGDVHVRVTGVLAGPLVTVTAVVPGGLPVDVDGARVVTVAELAVLAGEQPEVVADPSVLTDIDKDAPERLIIRRDCVVDPAPLDEAPALATADAAPVAEEMQA